MELGRAQIITYLEKLTHQHYSDDEKRRLTLHIDELVNEGLLAKYHTRRGNVHHLRPLKTFQ